MNAIPSYIPSNTTGEEVLAMLKDWLPPAVGYSVTEALEAERRRVEEEHDEESWQAGYETGRDEAESDLSRRLEDAAAILEGIPEGADAATDRAIAEALEILRNGA